MTETHSNFKDAIANAAIHLHNGGIEVHSETWQRLDITKSPQHAMLEVLNHTLSCFIDEDLNQLKDEIKPNLPWADDHFLERVGGLPLNPGEQYKNWPYYRNNKSNDIHRKNEQFSHTYMERIWPKVAGFVGELNNHGDPSIKITNHRGIRYGYGDFDDVVNLMLREPLTRQAFLPIWFPEDTGVVHGERVPCTLGYHFIMRDQQMNCVYYIRSCDYFRHFRDDIYLACRKVLWLLEQLRLRGGDRWHAVMPGTLTMHITSLHCFKQERFMLKRDFQ